MNISIIPDEICAVVPSVNHEYGDGTNLICIDGKEIFVNKSVKSIIKKIARLCLVDLDAVHKKYSDILNRKILIPIPLKNNIVFIPFKMREHMTKGDQVTGYVNALKIDRQIIIENKIVFLNGKEVEILNTKYTILERLNYADQVMTYMHKDKTECEKVNILKLDEIVKEVCVKYLYEKC